MARNNSGTIVASFTKNLWEEVRVSVDEYGGYLLMNLWVHNTKQGSGNYATTKGLSLRVEQYSKLLDAVLKIGEHLERKGLIHAPETAKPTLKKPRRRSGWDQAN